MAGRMGCAPADFSLSVSSRCKGATAAARAPGRDECDLSPPLGSANDERLRSVPDLLCCLNKGMQYFHCCQLRIIPCKSRVWQPQECPLQVHLEWLEREEALKIEPHLHCVAALWSPNTAIVDSHRSVNALSHLS